MLPAQKITSDNAKSFWSYVKKLKAENTLPTNMLLVFALYIARALDDIDIIEYDNRLESLALTEEEVYEIVFDLDNNINPGPDGILQSSSRNAGHLSQDSNTLHF